MAIEGFWDSKSFLEPPKTKKNDFLKKPDFRDLTNNQGGSHNSPGHPGTIRPLDTIQKLTI